MTSLVGRVRDQIDQRCLVSGGLKKDGCKVSMDGAPKPCVVVDFDKPGSPLGQNQTRCDYLFIAEGETGVGWITPLELKRGRLHADQVVRQLQAGASVAEKLILSGNRIKFRPVAVSGSASKAERAKLKDNSNRIRFHGRMEAVLLMSCGNPLAQVLR